MKRSLLLLLVSRSLLGAELAPGISDLRLKAILSDLPREARSYWLSEEKLVPLIEQLYLNRMVAEEARKLGALQDPLLRAKLANETEKILAKWRLSKLEEEIDRRDLTEAAREYFEAHREAFKTLPKVEVYHIQINPARWGKEEAKRRLEEVLERLKKGEPFTELAKNYSDDLSASKGGYIGWVDKRKLRIPTVWPEISKLEVGAWTWFETNFGYHIVKVTGKKPARQLTFEEAKPQVLAKLKEKLLKQATEAYLEEVKRNHPVEINREALRRLIEEMRQDRL